MKQRSPLTATLLSLFVPFYILYWFYVTAEELAKRGAKKPNFALLWAPFVGLAFMILLLILGSSGDGETNVFGVLGALVAVVSIIALIVCPLVYYYKFSEGVEQVTNKELTKGLLFVLFWFVSPAGVFLTQDKLNSMGENTSPSQSSGASTPTPPVTTPPADPV